MHLPPPKHSWDVSPSEAIQIQKALASQVDPKLPKKFSCKTIAGADLAFSRDGKQCIGGFVLWDIEEETILETCTARVPVSFSYIPGLLSFREAPALLAAYEKLKQEPDALMFDGQGLAHPRRLGLACHLGLLLDKPSLGCAKSRLTGTFQNLKEDKGSLAPLCDGEETIGAVVRTRKGIKPVFVSIGHQMDLPTAIELVLKCSPRYRIPEPTRQADKLVARAKNEEP